MLRYKTDTYSLYQGDALEEMKSLPDCSIDCVMTDPPYFIDGMGDEWDNGNLRRKTGHASVVGSLPVGMKFDPEQGRRLQLFMLRASEEAFRVLKPGGFYLSFSQGRLYHRMAMAIEDAGFEIRDMLVWEREGQAKAFSQDHFVRKMDIPEDEKERIIKSLAGRKTPQLKGTSEPIVLAQKPREGTFVQNWMRYGVGLIDVTAKGPDGKFPATVMRYEKPRGAERAESKHLTLKPIALMGHLVDVFTKPGDVILDPFMGSGTTGIAALEHGRRFVGMELTDEFTDEAHGRIETHLGRMERGEKEKTEAEE